jgi:hypothetical protein
MKPAALFSVIAAGFLLALAQTLGAIAGAVEAIVVGAADGLLVFPLFRLFGIEWEQPLLPLVTAVLASSIGTFVGSLGTPEPLSWQGISPLCAVASCLLAAFLGKGRTRVCQLCRQRLGNTMAFECPRCGLLVCERKCWRFDSCRCRLCADQAVSVFPSEARWWEEHFGARVPSGKCQLCLSEQADLRSCPQCGRLQCRECWDYANGQCGHCGWVVADLPPVLKRYMFPEERPGRGGKASTTIARPEDRKARPRALDR